MTKDQLIYTLHYIRNYCLFGMIVPQLIPPEQWAQIPFRPVPAADTKGDMYVDLEPLGKELAVSADREVLFSEFHMGLKRALVREGHELILWYCEETNQIQAYKMQPWFQFARLIRNAVSHKHGGMLEWPKDLVKKGITQVSWRSRTLDITMAGKELVFSNFDALQLFEDQYEFATKTLP